MTQAQTAAVQPDAIPVAAPTPQRWRVADVVALFELPFNDLMFRAAGASRAFRCERGAVDAAVDQDGRLRGGLRLLLAVVAPRHGLKAEKLMDVDAVLEAARAARRAARAASAWAPHGAIRKNATCRR
jgi:biotin synthase